MKKAPVLLLEALLRTMTGSSSPLQWHEQSFRLGELEVRLRLPTEPETLLDRMGAGAGLDEPEPYWAAVWPASVEMAKFVANYQWPSGTRAIELGCGLGLVSVAALSVGIDPLMSDYVPEAVAAAKSNAELNGFPDARAMTLDWRCIPRLTPVPLVLAADILYDRDSHQPVLDAIETLLQPRGEAWIGEPGRSVGLEFVDAAASRGFHVRIFDTQLVQIDRSACKLDMFRMLNLRRAIDFLDT